MEDLLVFFACILLAFFTLFSIFKCFFCRNNYWENQNVTVAEQDSILHQFLPANKAIQDIQIERHNKFGKLYGFYERNKPVLSIAEPELLKLIMVKNFEIFSSRRNPNSMPEIFKRMVNNATFKDWRRIRVKMSHTFSTLKLKKFTSLFSNCSTTLVHIFENSKCKENIVELKRIFSTFTTDAVSRTAFSTKIDSHDDPNNIFVKTATKVFEPCSFLKLLLFNIAGIIFGKWSYSMFHITSSLKFFESAAKQIAENRKLTGKVENDFLQMLMDASTDNVKWANHTKEIPENLKKENGLPVGNVMKSLTWDEIYSQCMIFYISGVSTTTSGLSFVTYLLALHQDVQDKVYQEIKRIIGQNTSSPTYEEIQKMKYLDSVISETFRLYPPAARLEREAVMDCNLGSTGIHIEKGVKICIPLFTLHRNPDFFPKPNVFNPDRFNEVNIKKIVPYSYMPFGAGPRKCVAYRYALLQTKVAVVKMLCAFCIQKCSQTKVPLEFHNGRHLMTAVDLLPKDIKVKLEPRRN